LTVDFNVMGTRASLNGGDSFKHSEAFSFQITTKDQAETDKHRNAIVGNGGEESQRGWCKDKWGVSWQITPRILLEALAAGGAKAKRAFEAMMPMKRIDVAAIEAAIRKSRARLMTRCSTAVDPTAVVAERRVSRAATARERRRRFDRLQRCDIPVATRYRLCLPIGCPA
jgi:hypothetical protein